jgi:hypothetical protein
MNNTLSRQAVFFSVLGHLTLFTMFGLSFGPRIPAANFTNVSFWGEVFRSSDLIDNRDFAIGGKTARLASKSEILALDKINRESQTGYRRLFNNDWQRKPLVSLGPVQDKIEFVEKVTPILLTSQLRQQPIMFYPRLPYRFTLYFKDRQTAHIELMFEVASIGRIRPVLVKRKISSGNLETDLLSMRYISRYLFMQQQAFLPNKWQTVKIDLSTGNENVH